MGDEEYSSVGGEHVVEPASVVGQSVMPAVVTCCSVP